METIEEHLAHIKHQFSTSTVHGTRHAYPGILAELEGLDFSGKGVGQEAIKAYLISQGKKVFDVAQWEREHDEYPSEDIWGGYDCLMVDQPSWCKMGRVVRNDLIASHNTGKYPARIVGRGYAADRFPQNAIVVRPALKLGLIVLESRGMSTSVVYQPIQDYDWRRDHPESPEHPLTIDEISSWDGNADELTLLPDGMILARTPAAITMARKATRLKQDHTYFERQSFQERLEPIFDSDEFSAFYERRGVRVLRFDGTKSPEETAHATVELFKKIAQARR